MLVENDDEALIVVGKMEGITPLGVEILYVPTDPAATTEACETMVINKPFSSNYIPGCMEPEAMLLTYIIVLFVTLLFAVIV